MAKVNWQNPPALPPIGNYRTGEGLTREMIDNWTIIEGIVRPSAAEAMKKRERFDQIFGKNNWAQGWKYEGKIIDRPEALALYEEAYYVYFKENPNDLEWLCKTASEVYDNAKSNIESGLDYTIQEAKSAHLQDIAIRRAVIRLGKKLQGDHPVEIHDEGSEGFHLNPGQVPFHKPKEIMKYPVKDWWEQNTVEAFWQHNKVILCKPDAIELKPEFVIENRTWCVLSEEWTVSYQNDDIRHLQATPLAEFIKQMDGVSEPGGLDNSTFGF